MLLDWIKTVPISVLSLKWLSCARGALAKHSAQVDLVTEVEEGLEEHQEVVALPEEVAAEAEEVEASLGQKEAQKLSSYVYWLSHR